MTTTTSTAFVINTEKITIKKKSVSSVTMRPHGQTTFRLEDGDILTTQSLEDALENPFTVHVARSFEEAKTLLVALLQQIFDRKIDEMERARVAYTTALSILEPI